MSDVTGQGRLAIIAGQGQLPVDVAEAAVRAGETPYIAALKEELDRDWSRFDHTIVSIGDYKGLIQALNDNSIGRVVLSGAVRRRPEFRDLRYPILAIYRLPMVVRRLLSGGDDAVLRMVIWLLEREGFRVVGAHEIAPDLLAETGALTAQRPTKADLSDVAKASLAAQTLGELDVGQGAVCVGGRIVALEGVEGTDQMLQRVADLRDNKRISQKKKGVLVKLCKPGQDERADLPTVGVSTIENAARAGLAGIAVEAGKALVLDRSEMLARADALGLFVVGIDPADIAGHEEPGR